MGDGIVYGWHRRGVPIPHVVLIAVALFAFGRITSAPAAPAGALPAAIPGAASGTPAASRAPTPLPHPGGADASVGTTEETAALRERVATAEREREQYKTLYQEREASLGRARADAEEAARRASGGDDDDDDDERETSDPKPAVPRARPSFAPAAHGASGNPSATTMDFQVLSWEPHAVLYRGFASAAECDAVRELAAKRLEPSGLALRKGERRENMKNIRTSSGTFLASASDPSGTLERIEARIADVTHVHRDHGEPFNVLRYRPGEKYDSHYDTFDPASYGPQVSQRVASVLLYLTDVEEGGETHFPLEGREGLERLRRGHIDYKTCEGGLRVAPRAGDALLFWNVHPNATLDKRALHGGCPVVRGEKWVATKWIRDKSFR